MLCGTSPLLTYIRQCKARWQNFLERFRDDSLIYWTFWICALALYGVLISPDNDLFGVFLFGVFRPTRELFTHMRRHHDRVRAAFFFYLYSALMAIQVLNSEGSLTCHTYCDEGIPFIMVIFEDPWHLHLLPSIWQWNCNYLF